MPENDAQQTPEQKQETPPQPQKVELDPEVIKKIHADAQAEAIKVAEAAARENANKIIKALGGGQDESKSKIHQRLIDDPSALLADVIKLGKDAALEEVRAQKEADEEENKKKLKAHADHVKMVDEFLEKRPDIKRGEASWDLLSGFYASTDASLPDADRLKAAEKKYNDAMQKIDGKTAEDRIKALADIAATSAKASEPVKVKTQTEARAAYLEARRERQEKQRRGQGSSIEFV